MRTGRAKNDATERDDPKRLKRPRNPAARPRRLGKECDVRVGEIACGYATLEPRVDECEDRYAGETKREARRMIDAHACARPKAEASDAAPSDSRRMPVRQLAA